MSANPPRVPLFPVGAVDAAMEGRRLKAECRGLVPTVGISNGKSFEELQALVVNDEIVVVLFKELFRFSV